MSSVFGWPDVIMWHKSHAGLTVLSRNMFIYKCNNEQRMHSLFIYVGNRKALLGSAFETSSILLKNSYKFKTELLLLQSTSEYDFLYYFPMNLISKFRIFKTS